eukprot:TRINITY_DN3658_c0_g1_i2.p1 TRINITY_DN3658_c0_g1~~TRINITY_DN3658_c0_g1_i2.p1  ORF type:complete len:428 (+),score=38.72 TRINITY_DN3658_c0_g1_i2:47-1330(+)
MSQIRTRRHLKSLRVEKRRSWMIKERKALQKGNMETIISWMFEQLDDDKAYFIDIFLVSYRQVCAPENLLITLEEIVSSEKGKIPSFKTGCLQFLKTWLQKFFLRDFFHSRREASLRVLLDFFKKLVDNQYSTDEINSLKLLTIRNTSCKTLMERDRAFQTELQFRLETPRCTTDFLDFDLVEITEQLCLIESRLFCSIQSHDFLKMSWKTDTKSAVHSLFNRFNTVSFWVVTEIVMAKDIDRRTEITKRFISLAEKCHELGNYNTLMEILSGINNVSVQRLKKMWSRIQVKYTQILEKLNGLMESDHNFKKYREDLHNRKGPTLPYLGITLRDITFIEEGNPDFIDDEINFEKLHFLGLTISEVLDFQHKYEYFENLPLQAILLKPLYLPDEILYKHSIDTEPRTNLSGTIQNDLSTKSFVLSRTL